MPVRNLFGTAVRLFALCAALTAGSAFADDYSDIAQLLHAGKTQQAQERIDAALARNARDPQMRLLHAVALTNGGKIDEAIAALRQLTEDYPELPEPYNNLAVIYAGQGELEKARAALQSAVRNNPGYAVAHENLGDIYARLAWQSYAQSQAAGSKAASLRLKMDQLRNLLQAVPAGAPAAPRPASN